MPEKSDRGIVAQAVRAEGCISKLLSCYCWWCWPCGVKKQNIILCVSSPIIKKRAAAIAYKAGVYFSFGVSWQFLGVCRLDLPEKKGLSGRRSVAINGYLGMSQQISGTRNRIIKITWRAPTLINTISVRPTWQWLLMASIMSHLATKAFTAEVKNKKKLYWRPCMVTLKCSLEQRRSPNHPYNWALTSCWEAPSKHCRAMSSKWFQFCSSM